jgi:predicted DNA-binding transcriptional regulator AlpA
MMAVKTSEIIARAPLEQLLNVADLERLLRVDRRTVRRLWQRGQLPRPIKVGGGNRWKSAEVADALGLLGSERDPTRTSEDEAADAV